MAAVYLAGRYGRRDELRVYATQLRERGHTVTSRWLEGDHDTDGLTLEEGAFESERRRWAEEDLADLRAARVLIAFGERPDCAASRGGRHVELGVALAERKRVIVIGPRENVFMTLACVEQYDTWDDMLAHAPLGRGTLRQGAAARVPEQDGWRQDESRARTVCAAEVRAALEQAIGAGRGIVVLEVRRPGQQAVRARVAQTVWAAVWRVLGRDAEADEDQADGAAGWG